jgi:hypothetical protein
MDGLGVAINWTENKAYVSYCPSAGFEGVCIYDRDTNTRQNIDTTNDATEPLVFNPSVNRLYSDTEVNAITTIFNGATNAFTNIPLVQALTAVDVHYATDNVFYAGASGTYVMKGSTGQIIAQFPVGASCSLCISAIAINQTTGRVYVINETATGKVTVIDDSIPVTISGNASVNAATLSYTNGTPRTASSQINGSYSFQVPSGWSGTVTPTHPCYTFNPANRSYSNIATNQPGQNYAATIKAGCADLTISVGGFNRGRFGLPSPSSTRASLTGVNGGPVKLTSTNAVSVLGAERVLYKVNGVNTSFTEMMGLPASQLDTTYWLPWYNNVDLDTQLRIANVSGSQATVTVTVGGVPQPSFNLAAGASTRVSYPVNNGPVKIVSTQNIVAAERVIYKVNNVNTSFTEMMALPAKQLDKTYYLPWYNNVDLDTQLRIANVSSSPATVTVTIGGVAQPAFNLPAGASTRVSYPVNNGPVKIQSTQNIIAAERVIYKANNVNTSFSEMMALPANQLNTTYWLPWYNNADLDTQLRIANVSGSQATVTVTIGGVAQPSFNLAAGASMRASYAANNGPVKIVSTQNIVAAERVIYSVSGISTSFSEMMGLPNSQLSTTYWLPWYNNVDLDTQLRFGIP